MNILYPAVFHEEDGSYWLEFPDLSGAMANAKEALSLSCKRFIREVSEKSIALKKDG